MAQHTVRLHSTCGPLCFCATAIAGQTLLLAALSGLLTPSASPPSMCSPTSFSFTFFFFSNNVPGKCELKICLLGLWVSSGASCLPGDPPAAGDPEQAAATPWPCPACRVLPLGNLTEVRFNLTDLPLEHGRRECQRKNCVSPTKLVYKMKGFPHHCRGKWTIYRLWFLTSQGTEMSTQNCPDRRDYLKQMG